MHKNTTKCNKTLSKWCKNKHGSSKIIDTFDTYHAHHTFLLGFPTGCYFQAIKHFFSGAVAGEEEDFFKGSLSRTIFYFVFVLLYFIFACIILSKNTKKISSYFNLLFMSSLVVVTMSPEEMIFTFKQKSEESFKEAWSRIYDWHGKTEPKMILSLLLSRFYFGLALCYRYVRRHGVLM
jgi:hypothetical protein